MGGRRVFIRSYGYIFFSCGVLVCGCLYLRSFYAVPFSLSGGMFCNFLYIILRFMQGSYTGYTICGVLVFGVLRWCWSSSHAITQGSPLYFSENITATFVVLLRTNPSLTNYSLAVSVWVVAFMWARGCVVAAGVAVRGCLTRCLVNGCKAPSDGMIHLPSSLSLCRFICSLLRGHPTKYPISDKGLRLILPRHQRTRLPNNGPLTVCGCVNREKTGVLSEGVGAVVHTRLRSLFSRGGRICNVSCVGST